MSPGHLNQVWAIKKSPGCLSGDGKLLTHFDNVLTDIVRKFTRSVLRIENGVDSGYRENRSRIVERVPNLGIVAEAAFCSS
jgi:hypothetical protein